MHDSEWARYMLEVLYLLWFQVFCSTLPIYSSHAPSLIDFARKILSHIRHRIKPMRDIEFIYRRLFEACGTTKQINELRDMHKEMIKNKIEPDKVTSGVYY
jgi:pentatricopeptide repeat protein